MTSQPGRPDFTREKLLTAALEIYGRGGSRAATTKRIAEHAGVNEVTLFRHFRSKDQLLASALDHLRSDVRDFQLPSRPRAPHAELMHWCTRVLEHLRERATVTRTCLAETSEHHELAEYVAAAPRHALAELRRYLAALRDGALTDGSVNADAHASGLVAALFTDALTRDVLPEILPAQRHVPARYVDALLAALGVTPPAAPVRARAAPPPSLPDATGA